MSTVDVEIAVRPKGRSRPPERVGPAAAPRIPRITRLMALAIKFQDMVDRGEVRDYADLARLGYVSRARVTQIMNLLLLAPDIQEQLLSPDEDRRGPRETHLRQLVSLVCWRDQRSHWIKITLSDKRSSRSRSRRTAN